MNDVHNVAVNTLNTAGMGSIAGMAIAVFKGYSVPATAFSMGMNWGILGLPFYSLRSGMISYRRKLNHENKIENFVRRDRDELLSSAFAGAVVGIAAGYIYRGRYGISPGFFMFTGIAMTGQVAYTLLRHLRIYMALNNSTTLKEHNYTSLKDKITFQKFKMNDAKEADTKKWDPIRDAFEGMVSLIASVVDIPEWASPLTKALDEDYRRELNAKIRALEDEIQRLKG